MTIQQGIFYAFSTLALLGASGVVFAKHPVRAVLALVLTFVSTAALWLLLQAEFLSMILVIVYVGAIMVLFLFVIMMLDIELVPIREGFVRYWFVGLLTAIAFSSVLIYSLDLKERMLPVSSQSSNIKALGLLLYTEYLFPVELAAILLFIAMVSAIALTFRGKQKSKAISPSVQVSVSKADRLRIVTLEKEPKP